MILTFFRFKLAMFQVTLKNAKWQKSKKFKNLKNAFCGNSGKMEKKKALAKLLPIQPEKEDIDEWRHAVKRVLI